MAERLIGWWACIPNKKFFAGFNRSFEAEITVANGTPLSACLPLLEVEESAWSRAWHQSACRDDDTMTLMTLISTLLYNGKRKLIEML
jgi:hypothetical protein